MITYLNSIDVGRPYEPLVVCNVCLRVLSGEQWVDAEDVIREIRSFDLPSLPTLLSSLCTNCSEALHTRGGEAQKRAAA
jgi:hypothetical protein